MHLTRRLACGVAVMAALLYLAAAQPGRTQSAPPPASSGQSAAPSQTPAQSPPAGQSAGPSSDQPPATGDILAKPPTAATHGVHKVTVTFDYDFRVTPACTAKVTKNCVLQFIAFDISSGTKNAPMLFPIALPANPVGAVLGITKTGPAIDFESGQHLISVSAMSPNGTHSRQSLCTTWITIP